MEANYFAILYWFCHRKNVYSSFPHILIELFVFLLLSGMSCLYILEINPFPVVSFAIFSHFEGCLFTLLIVSFAVQKFLSLIRSHFFTFVFHFHYSRRRQRHPTPVLLPGEFHGRKSLVGRSPWSH